ncbi:hypothetical protein [uncultured Cellulomonas sp.]|uniref:hypothetical protein n=1 Tax=uncultured Cellulomonas sp. TaxID=189682 RepID=UPI00261DE805|nr:hypothetical protein [uncultured Cellulomonas sp.]
MKALDELWVGTSRHESRSVVVAWKNGATKTIDVHDLNRIMDVDRVLRIYVNWRFDDGSTVEGYLIRPEHVFLSVRGGGLAMAATHRCRDELAGVRPGRARIRGIVSGLWIPSIWLVLLLAYSVWAELREPGSLLAGVSQTLSTPLVLVLVILWNFLVYFGFRTLSRRFGGGHLVRKPAAQGSWLTAEVGVAAGVLAALLALGSFVVAMLALRGGT